MRQASLQLHERRCSCVHAMRHADCTLCRINGIFFYEYSGATVAQGSPAFHSGSILTVGFLNIRRTRRLRAGDPSELQRVKGNKSEEMSQTLRPMAASLGKLVSCFVQRPRASMSWGRSWGKSNLPRSATTRTYHCKDEARNRGPRLTLISEHGSVANGCPAITSRLCLSPE